MNIASRKSLTAGLPGQSGILKATTTTSPFTHWRKIFPLEIATPGAMVQMFVDLDDEWESSDLWMLPMAIKPAADATGNYYWFGEEFSEFDS